MKKKMKKKDEWLTKAMKRKVKEGERGIVDLMRIVFHFFRELPQWINEMTDPRNLSYITYTQSDLVWMGLLKNICAVKTMRSMEELFNEEACIATLRILSGDKKLGEMPHADTLNLKDVYNFPEMMAVMLLSRQNVISGKGGVVSRISFFAAGFKILPLTLLFICYKI